MMFFKIRFFKSLWQSKLDIIENGQSIKIIRWKSKLWKNLNWQNFIINNEVKIMTLRMITSKKIMRKLSKFDMTRNYDKKTDKKF